MDGFFGALKRLTLTTNHTKWSPQFSRMVAQVSQRNVTPGGSSLTPHERIGILRKLDPYVKQRCFTNTDEREILQAKKDLLHLWEYLLEFVVIMHKPALKELGYALIVMLMQREEFTLRRLGFGKKSGGPTCSAGHIKLAEKYKTLLMQTFHLVMKSMTAKGKFAEIIHFSAQTLVVFFFRLPLVGGRIIDALQSKAASQRALLEKESSSSSSKSESESESNNAENTKDSNEGGSSVDETSSAPSSSSSSASSKTERSTKTPKKALSKSKEDLRQSDFIANNPDLYQWSYFNTQEEAEALGPSVLRDDNACLAWLSTKETFFLTFVEVYVVHVESVSTKPVEWQVIPAYDLLLECFWPLLKSSMWWDGICRRKVGESSGWVSSLPAYMRVKRSALALLSNKALLNNYIKLTYECTNLNSLLSVDSCVEHLNLWFSTVAYSATAKEGIVNHNQNSRNLPPKQTISSDVTAASFERPKLPDSFDYPNFWFGIEKLLESELFQVLLKVCSLLYNTLHLFQGQCRIQFVTDLMNRFFFRLFLHWSSEVRTFFMLTLVYKVLRADRRNLPCFTDAQVIKDFGSQSTESTARPIMQRRFSFGEKSNSAAASNRDESYVPPNVYSGQGSVERRMAIFDDTNTTDNEELLLDIMFCSKIDAYIRMCLEKDDAIPEDKRAYIEPALRQYADLLKKYYKGVATDNLETLPSLAHRMIYNHEFGSS